MSCDDLALEALGGRPLSAMERAHADACLQCRDELARQRAIGAVLAGQPDPAAAERTRAQAHAALQARRTPTSWDHAWLLAFMAALVPGAAALFGLHVRPDWADLAMSVRTLNVLLLAGVFLVATAVAFQPGLQLRLGLVAMAIGLGGAYSLLVLPGGQAGEPAGSGFGCLLGIILISAAPLAALLAVLHLEGSDRARGFYLGLGAGALGEMAFFRFCPASSAPHMLFHLCGWVAVCAAGWVLGGALRVPLWRPSRGPGAP